MPRPCARCGEPDTPPDAACWGCAAHPREFHSTNCAYLYAEPVDQMITALKFGQELVYARVLGGLLADHIQTHRGAKPLPDCLLPLPLHPSRLRDRGFNQAQEIAKVVGRQLALHVETRALRRTRATAAQSQLDAAERERNLRGAFALRPGSIVPRHVALIDDVLTTGHTASAAAHALRRAGVQQVEVWACARAARQA